MITQHTHMGDVVIRIGPVQEEMVAEDVKVHLFFTVPERILRQPTLRSYDIELTEATLVHDVVFQSIPHPEYASLVLRRNMNILPLVGFPQRERWAASIMASLNKMEPEER
jgi:hypothetical protein